MIKKIIDGTYTVESLIAQTGVNAVYKARNLRLGTYAAVKTGPGTRRHEADAMSRVWGSSSPKAFAFTRQDNSNYLVMEYIEGKPLGDIAASGEYRKYTLRWYRQLALLLCGLHGNDVCHRDVKPGNIIIRDNTKDAVLIDYGSALVDGKSSGKASRSAGYSSPEQAEYFRICEEACKTRCVKPEYMEFLGDIKWELTDIYSLGATMYFAYTGKILGPNDVIGPNGDGLLKVMKKSTQKDPSKRYQSAEELLAALDRLI